MEEDKKNLKSMYRKMKIGMKDFKKVQGLLLYQDAEEKE